MVPSGQVALLVCVFLLSLPFFYAQLVILLVLPPVLPLGYSENVVVCLYPLYFWLAFFFGFGNSFFFITSSPAPSRFVAGVISCSRFVLPLRFPYGFMRFLSAGLQVVLPALVLECLLLLFFRVSPLSVLHIRIAFLIPAPFPSPALTMIFP